MSGYENLPLAIGLWVFAGLWLVGAAVVPSLVRRHARMDGDHPDSGERKRRAQVMTELRAKWRRQRLMDPSAMPQMPWEDDDPPAAWLNRELAKRGELWTIPED